jgi:hypothetical protein
MVVQIVRVSIGSRHADHPDSQKRRLILEAISEGCTVTYEHHYKRPKKKKPQAAKIEGHRP